MAEKFIIIGSEGDRAQCPYCFAFFIDNGERYCSEDCAQKAADAKTAERRKLSEEMGSSDPL